MNEFEYIKARMTDMMPIDYEFRSFGNGYRFDRKLDINNGKCTLFHYKGIPDKILNKVLIDHSWEPLEFFLDREMYNFFKREKDRSKQYTIICSEYNSKDREYIYESGINIINWFSHGLLCSEHWYRLYKDVNIITDIKPIQHRWINVNRLIDLKRSYRIKFLNLLDTSKGIYSLPEKDICTGRRLIDINPENKIIPHSFDENNNSSAYITVRNFNIITGKYEWTNWSTSFLHVVTETVVDRQHLTEKIFKPIVLHQPFVLMGGAGCLGYLKSYGFETFDRWWDESYDELDDIDQRMQAVANIVNWIGSMSISQLEDMRDEMWPVIKHNYNWFYNGFGSKCWEELAEGFRSLY